MVDSGSRGSRARGREGATKAAGLLYRVDTDEARPRASEAAISNCAPERVACRSRSGTQILSPLVLRFFDVVAERPLADRPVAFDNERGKLFVSIVGDDIS